MVKREDILTKMKGYSEDKLSALEALYMWSRGIDSKTIGGVLGNKYESTEGFNIMKNDLSSMDIKGRSDLTELTNEQVEVVIGDIFRTLQQALLDKTIENLATLGMKENNVLLALIRSALFEREKIKLDELKIAYHAIFGQVMRDFDLINVLLSLEKIGIFYCERPYSANLRMDTIIIPSFIYSIQSQIEAKLRKVIISNEEEEA